MKHIIPLLLACLLIPGHSLLFAQNHSLLMDINPGTDTTRPAVVRDIEDGWMYFRSMDNTGKPTIWRTNGSSSGTSRFAVAEVAGSMRAIDGVVYFRGMYNLPDGSEPWRSDGTSAGTFMLANINPKDASSYSYDFVPFNNEVYFRTRFFKRKNGSPYLQDYNWELWKTDGSAAGTGKVGSMPFHMDLTSTGGTLLLDGIDLYASAGAGVSELVDVCATFPANWYASCMSEPYAGWPRVYRTDAIRKPVVVNGIYYQTLFDGASGGELWRSDGTAAGTWQCTDINPGAGSSYPSFLIAMGNHLYFAAYSPGFGTEIWRYPLNGTSLVQAERVCDIVPGSGSSEPMWLTVKDNTLYFSAWRELEGRELWKSDGLPNGTTVLVQDINPGPAGSDPQYTSVEYDGGGDGDKKFNRSFVVLGENIYFAATEPQHGYELWKSDGSAAGTGLAADVYAGPESSFVRGLTVLNGRVLFKAYEPSVGWEWWVYDTGANLPPVASAAANPLSGSAPLLVTFSGSGSYDPEDGSSITYSWDFGDGSGTSTQMNPTHTYANPGTYIATLTVVDQGNATGSSQVTITVLPAASGYVYVADQVLSRVSMPGNKIAAENLVVIEDENGAPVSGAIVYASFSGPTTGSVSGSTDANGEVTLTSTWDRNPSGTWCFEITDVQVSGKSYEPGNNLVSEQICEGIPRKGVLLPSVLTLHQNHPNPFNPTTMIRFTLPRPMTVSLVVTDALGREIARLADQEAMQIGTHALRFNAAGLPSGVYLYRLETEVAVLARKMVVMR